MEQEDDVTEGPWVRVHTLGNRFEADLLVYAMEQEAIPVRLRTYEETPYDGLFVPQRGWGALFVPRDFEERARELIGRVLTSAPQEHPPAPGVEDEDAQSVNRERGKVEPA